MNFSVLLNTKLFGRCVGKDEAGNKYYESGGIARAFHKGNRWVWYSGTPEPSKIPPQWYHWLHYQTDELPGKALEKYEYNWEKERVPNLTGTKYAYYPSGHVLSTHGKSHGAAGYEPWRPK